MRASFIGQPFSAAGGRVADDISELIAQGHWTELHVAVAWAKRSGLERLRPALTEFRRSGGRSAIVIGIDEGGATVQGLRSARDLVDEVHVFHEPGSRTFHPKVYLLCNDGAAAALIGSSNFTAGGLYSNYEACVLIELDLADRGDADLYSQLRDWLKGLYDEPELCLELTAERLEELYRDNRYRVGDEDRRGERGGAPPDEADDEVTPDAAGESMFGKAQRPRAAGAPPLGGAARPTRERDGGRERRAATDGRGQAAPLGASVARWSKRMSRTDAQYAPAGTNVTGHLKLTQAQHPIDQKVYFRDDFFGNLAWSTEQEARGDKETATCAFDVVFDGQDLGTVPLEIDHAEYRIADQNNVPTWLHWGALADRLRGANFSGWWVTIERFAGGRYGLRISSTEPTVVGGSS